MSLPPGPIVFAVVAIIGGTYAAQTIAALPRASQSNTAQAPAPMPLQVASVEPDEPVLSGSLRIPGKAGQFELEARMGTRTTPFIVDTGASIVALTWETGYNLGLVSIGDKLDAKMSTANGTVMGKFVTISRIETGTLRVDNVPAVVMPRGALAQNLLGMSFLGRLKAYSVANGVMTLKQ